VLLAKIQINKRPDKLRNLSVVIGIGRAVVSQEGIRSIRVSSVDIGGTYKSQEFKAVCDVVCVFVFVFICKYYQQQQPRANWRGGVLGGWI
jgi:hypothetical protein